MHIVACLHFDRQSRTIFKAIGGLDVYCRKA